MTVKIYLTKINKIHYKKIFYLTYRFFLNMKPSQLWIIVLALLNKTEFKKILTIPSLFILFSSLFYNSENPEFFKTKLDENTLFAKLQANHFTDPENKWENFFWFIIILALIKRFISTILNLLWFPFKIALIYYVLKYFGIDLTYLFNILNTLSLGIIDWFYHKITEFLNLVFKNK